LQDNKDSFDNIKEKWVPEIKAHDSKVPFFLIGCKGDLRKSGGAVVNLEEANALAREVGAKAYMECSASTKSGVDEIFVEATKVALAYGNKGGEGGCCIVM
jgi:GTPase SAR1 family protein